MSTQTVPGEVLNELFLNKLGTEEGKTKVAQLGGEYILHLLCLTNLVSATFSMEINQLTILAFVLSNGA